MSRDLSLIHQVRAATVGAAPYPALLLLHGLGSNEADLMGLAPYVDSQVTVLSARAPAPHFGGYSWYPLDTEGSGLQGPGIQRSLEQLLAFVDEAGDAYELDPARVFVGGFSQGAAMAGALALLHPDRFAGAVMASGYLPPDDANRYRLEAAAGFPIFQAHGTQDTTVSLEYGHMTRDFLLAANVDLTYREYPMAHEVSLPELMDLTAWFGTQLARAPRTGGSSLSP